MGDLAEILRQFGPTGLTIIIMGGGLIYLTKWLREMQEKSAEQHDKARGEFTNALKDQRTENNAALREVVGEFKSSLADLGGEVKDLGVRVDRLDEHIRGK